MKACEIAPENRIAIGIGYSRILPFRRAIGVSLIYVPIVLFPFAILIASLTLLSLRVLGAKNIKSYWDFVPKQRSHRYDFGNQIVMNPPRALPHLGWKVFWQFNCNWYCPMSVALFEYLTYLVKSVENWWCPFFHDRKEFYSSAPLDGSYWHAKNSETHKLHPDDRENPIWNESSPLVKIRERRKSTAGDP